MSQDNFPRSDWYAPARAAAPLSPHTQPRQPQRKRHTGLKIASIALCVLLLLVASVYAFSDSFGLHLSFRGDRMDGEHSFSFELPGPAEKETLPAETPDQDDSFAYDKDYKDFFSKFYVPEDRSANNEASSIRRGETGAAFRIALESAEGKPELSLKELYADCVQSVVGVKATVKGKMGYFWGTGIIMSEDGFILTNQHIIAGTDAAEIILSDGTSYPALLIGEDTQMDIAVLKIEAEGLHPATFGDSGALSVGDSVVAIGNPLTDSLSGTMTNGIISAIDRNVNMNNHPMTLLQTNAALNEGNSGGPLFNMFGQVIGVTNMKMANPYSDVAVEGLGFAIPSVTAKVVSDQLIATGSYVRPGIGIVVGEMNAQDAEHYGLPGGLYISSVSPESDAAAKGVQPGDVLTHVNGIEVHKTDDVLSIRDAMQIGDIMTLTIYRDGRTFDVEIELYDLGKLY